MSDLRCPNCGGDNVRKVWPRDTDKPLRCVSCRLQFAESVAEPVVDAELVDQLATVAEIVDADAAEDPAVRTALETEWLGEPAPDAPKE